jgi:hypothetical protein
MRNKELHKLRSNNKCCYSCGMKRDERGGVWNRKERNEKRIRTPFERNRRSRFFF